MGQAKRRGDYESRKANAIKKRKKMMADHISQPSVTRVTPHNPTIIAYLLTAMAGIESREL